MEEGMDLGSKLAWRISSNRNLLETIEAPHPPIPEAVWAMPGYSYRCYPGDKMVRSRLTISSVPMSRFSNSSWLLSKEIGPMVFHVFSEHSMVRVQGMLPLGAGGCHAHPSRGWMLPVVP